MKKYYMALVLLCLIEFCAGQAYWIYLEAEKYFHGSDGYEQSYDRAFELYGKAADLGNVASLRQQGICYYNGYGVEISKRKSFVDIKKAADYGDTLSMVMLISYYLDGEGCRKSMKKSFKYAYRAADQGNERAIQFLQQFSCYIPIKFLWEEETLDSPK